MLRNRVQWLAAILACTALFFGACTGAPSPTPINGSGATSGTPAAPAAPDVVNISLSYAVDPVAIGLGTDAYAAVEKEFNTHINWVQFDSGPATRSAMIAGALDIMLLQMDSVAAMVKAQVPVQVLTATQQGGIVTIVANKQYQATRGSGLQALKNFDGATWGIPSVGGAGELFIKLAAQAAGLDWSKQKVVVVGNSGAGPALQSGRVDIAASSPIAMYAAMGTDGYTVFNTSSQEGIDKVWGKVLGGLMIANKAFVQKYPQLSVALTAATIASLQKFQSFTDPHVAFQSFTPDYRAQVPSESAYVLGFPDSQQVSLGVDGLLRQSEVDNTIKVLQQAGTVPADASFDPDIFNNDFAAEAFKRLGQPVPKQ